MNICLGSFILGYEFSVYSPCRSSVSYANNWLNNPDEHFIHGVLNASLPFGVMLGILISSALFPLPRRTLFIINDAITSLAILMNLHSGFNQLFLGTYSILFYSLLFSSILTYSHLFCSR
jgi:hypothetical protein